MGDFSRDPDTTLQDAIAKNYSRVRFQQGKPLLDRELNLLADLASPQRFAQNNFGNGVRSEGDDFLITGLSVPNNDFTITGGSCLVNGYEIVLAGNTTYKNQPRNEHVANLPGGVSNVYLRVFRSEVTGAQDALLLNAGDVGSETAVRERVEWEVLVSTVVIATSDHFLLAVINTLGPTVDDRRRRGLNVSAMRDELATARGSTAQLGTRLDVSLAANGSLRPNIVGNVQVADNAITANKIVDGSVGTAEVADGAVTTPKIADNAVTTQKIPDNAVGTAKIPDNAINAAKIANNAVTTAKIADANVTTPKLALANFTEPILANNSVSNRTILNGSVSIAKLNAPQVVNLQVSVPAAPAPGQRGETVVTLQELDDHAFFMVSVHFDGPRPVLPPLVASLRSFDWFYRVALNKFAGIGSQPYRHFHQVVIQNPNTAEISVTVRAFRISEV